MAALRVADRPRTCPMRPAARTGIQQRHCLRHGPQAYSCLREDVPASPTDGPRCTRERMSAMADMTNLEQQQVDRANASGLKPVVFVHGLWLLSSSWDRWRALYEENGYTTLAPTWPDDPESVDEARRSPEVFAKKMVRQVTEHYLDAIGQLTIKPAVVGHSFGGLIAQRIAGTGASAVTVAIDPAPFRGVLPLPASALKSAAPVIANPANAKRAVSLTFDEFRFGWANAVDEDEARQLFDTFHVAASGVPLFQAATANLNPFTEAKVDTKNPDRGPLLIISGE